jgi:hypothetical protein
MTMRLRLLLPILVLFLLPACRPPAVDEGINPDLRFELKYGSFEDEINLFTNSNGEVHTRLAMRDGLFYIVNGESRKILQLNSYGDLLTFYYNPDSTPAPAFEGTQEDLEENINTTQRSQRYPFNNPSLLAVDSRKYLYVVDQVPPERQERDTQQRLLLAQVVFRFDAEGKFIDYIGQQGPGGTPFPFIKDIFVTANNELVVACQAATGMIVYWYSPDGFMLYTVPIHNADLPSFSKDGGGQVIASLKKIVPDAHVKDLYLDIDYYTMAVDKDSGVQYGMDYTMTAIHRFSVTSGAYSDYLTVPPLEQEDYFLTWDFLGLTETGTFFFYLVDDSGYQLQIIDNEGDRVQRHHLNMDASQKIDKLLYSSFALSGEGIISAILADDDGVKVVWWRTDALLKQEGEGRR